MGQMPGHHLQPQPELGHAIRQLRCLEQGPHRLAPAAGHRRLQRRPAAEWPEDALLPERLRVEGVQGPQKRREMVGKWSQVGAKQ